MLKKSLEREKLGSSARLCSLDNPPGVTHKKRKVILHVFSLDGIFFPEQSVEGNMIE